MPAFFYTFFPRANSLTKLFRSPYKCRFCVDTLWALQHYVACRQLHLVRLFGPCPDRSLRESDKSPDENEGKRIFFLFKVRPTLKTWLSSTKHNPIFSFFHVFFFTFHSFISFFFQRRTDKALQIGYHFHYSMASPEFHRDIKRQTVLPRMRGIHKGPLIGKKYI